MSTMNITFKHPDEIIDFLNTVCKFDFNMDMRRGRAVVDLQCLSCRDDSGGISGNPCMES